MARGGGRSSGGSSAGGGLLSNFVFGVFGVNQCTSDDDDWYCQLSRMFSGLLMILVILFIAYTIISFLFAKKRRPLFGGRKK